MNNPVRLPRTWSTSLSAAVMMAVVWSALAPASATVAADAAGATAQDSPPVRVECGGYAVVPAGFAVPDRPTRLSLQKGGRLLETVSDWRISAVDCSDIVADPTEELIVRSFSGGKHCCETTRVFALDGPAPRLLLLYEGGIAGGVEVRDLDGDGRKELILGDDSFAYFGDLDYDCSPARLPLVACFADGRFGDCSRQFPDFLREGRDRYLARLTPPEGQEALTGAKGNGLGVLAFSELLGDVEQGLAAIRRVVANEQVMGWLARVRPQVRDWAAARSRKLKRGDAR